MSGSGLKKEKSTYIISLMESLSRSISTPLMMALLIVWEMIEGSLAMEE